MRGTGLGPPRDTGPGPFLGVGLGPDLNVGGSGFEPGTLLLRLRGLSLIGGAGPRPAVEGLGPVLGALKFL
jgi:hypothetical protein